MGYFFRTDRSCNPSPTPQSSIAPSWTALRPEPASSAGSLKISGEAQHDSLRRRGRDSWQGETILSPPGGLLQGARRNPGAPEDEEWGEPEPSSRALVWPFFRLPLRSCAPRASPACGEALGVGYVFSCDHRHGSPGPPRNPIASLQIGKEYLRLRGRCRAVCIFAHNASGRISLCESA